jgi:FtsH-binding integral membrane protein
MNTPEMMYSIAEREAAVQSAVTRVYGWMMAGLLVTAATAFFTAGNETLVRTVFGTPLVFWGLVLAELALVWTLGAAIQRMSAMTATTMFVVYSALNGVTLAAVFLVYTAESLTSTFLVTAGTFGAMAVYGSVTRRDLTSVGSFMFMGLIGLILASVVNIFLASPMITWITTIVGIFIFVGLTAYDAQKVKELAEQGVAGGAEMAQKASILGALRLYLDFVNLFLYLLRIFGNRRN